MYRQRPNIIQSKIMEILTSVKGCASCQAIQHIVQSNEQMIQQQIKLIKTLHQEKTNLQEEKYQIQMKYADLQTKMHKYEQINCQKESTAQQTEPQIKETENQITQRIHEQRFLRTSNKQNTTHSLSMPNKPNLAIHKQNLHEFIPIVMIRKDDQYFSRKRKNSYDEEFHTQHWLKAIQHPGKKVSFKFIQKTQGLIKKNVPHQLRHIVWPLAVENQLAITDELYFELLERKNQGLVSEDVKVQIEKDINRSFSGRTQYEAKVGLKAEVTQILELFHLYRPDVSYIQGMTYPAIVLALVVGKVKAFLIFSNLVLCNSFIRRLFTFEHNFVLVFSRTFDILLQQYCHDIAQKMALQKIDSQVFLVEWFFTLFSRSLSFQATLKFWDQLIYFGQVTLYRLALSIFQIIGSRLMDTNYQETLGLIQGFSGFTSESKLFDLMIHHKLSSQRLNKTLQKIERMMGGFRD